MREFKNKKAQELFLASLELDMWASDKEKQPGYEYDETPDIVRREACSLRVLADDIEDRIIKEEDLEI
ncbi:MAG: hypothetical protein IJK18_01820 [Clostridia bacterium]|nr:hypothetical protein [Clostridia bacterium]